MDELSPDPTKFSSIPSTSPTHIETDWFCRRATYWARVFKGEGLRTTRFNEDKEVGIRFHAGVAAFHRSGNPESAIDTVRHMPLLTEPWQTWLEVSLYAWCTRVWPRLAKHYRIVSVEERQFFNRIGVRYKCFTDLLLEDTRDHTLWIYDFKSFKWWDARRYVRSIQLQIGALAVEDRYADTDDFRTVAGSIIQGVSKGTVRGDHLYHPLVFGYRKEAESEGPKVSKAAYSYRWKRGFERFCVLSFPDGWRAWVDNAPDEVIADCFPCTDPIFLNRSLMDTFFKQRASRESEIHLARIEPELLTDHGLDTLFPQSLSNCESDRHRCDWFEACHSPTVNRDPVGSGLYELRFHRTLHKGDGPSTTDLGLSTQKKDEVV